MYLCVCDILLPPPLSTQQSVYEFYNQLYADFPSTPMVLGIVDIDELSQVLAAQPEVAAVMANQFGFIPPPSGNSKRRRYFARSAIDAAVLPALASGDPSGALRLLASAGFNTFVAPTDGDSPPPAGGTFFDLLNAAMAAGAVMLAAPPRGGASVWDVAGLRAGLIENSCHPSMGE